MGNLFVTAEDKVFQVGAIISLILQCIQLIYVTRMFVMHMLAINYKGSLSDIHISMEAWDFLYSCETALNTL